MSDTHRIFIGRFKNEAVVISDLLSAERGRGPNGYRVVLPECYRMSRGLARVRYTAALQMQYRMLACPRV